MSGKCLLLSAQALKGTAACRLRHLPNGCKSTWTWFLLSSPVKLNLQQEILNSSLHLPPAAHQHDQPLSCMNIRLYVWKAGLLALLANGTYYMQLQEGPCNTMYVGYLLTGHDQGLFSTFVRVLMGQQPCPTQHSRHIVIVGLTGCLTQT